VVPQASDSRAIPALTRFDFESFRQQEMVFAVLNLFVLGALLLLHSVFSSLLGSPSTSLLLTLGAAFLLRMLELLWLWAGAPSLSRVSADFIAWASISFNLGLALVLTLLTNREDSPYFVLLALPVLQAAYRFGLLACIGVLVMSDAMTFFWVWHFASFHPPVHVSEYFEAGVISLVYALMGLLVWLLVNQLRRDQERLSDNFSELQRAREKLLVEEKLAAVGRLSSAVAHEIRNPVAIIHSSLATAERVGLAEEDRKDMYSIARAEAERLEKLTGDFLGYARPASPRRGLIVVADMLGYIAEVARVHASKKGITISVEADGDLCASLDRDQVQRALLNLLFNAVDAAGQGGALVVRAMARPNGWLELQVENSGDPIPEEVLSHMFEPFYTTKPQGTGLGLAISRNIARVHGGELWVAGNENGQVCFAMTISNDEATPQGASTHGEIINC
jgi:two-component system sensor histidine kinase HydH